MTIPFEMGKSAKAHRFERQLESDDPRSSRTGGFAVKGLSRMRMKLCDKGFQPCLRVSPHSATIHKRNFRSSNIVCPRVEQCIRSIGAGSSTLTRGVCAQSSAPGSKQRPAELQIAAAAEFRRVIVDYLDRNVVEPQTILIEPPDGSANRSDRPVSGTVCR